MQWLTSEDPDFPNRSRVDIYVTKQRAYTQAVENKTRAFDDALKHASNDPLNKTIAQQREAYDRWVAENARTYRNYVQAAYMDWVVIGKKEAVEYWFAVVDTDSAMARVEQSKVSTNYFKLAAISLRTPSHYSGMHARVDRHGYRWFFRVPEGQADS